MNSDKVKASRLIPTRLFVFEVRGGVERVSFCLLPPRENIIAFLVTFWAIAKSNAPRRANEKIRGRFKPTSFIYLFCLIYNLPKLGGNLLTL